MSKAIKIQDIAIDGGTQQREHVVYVIKQGGLTIRNERLE